MTALAGTPALRDAEWARDVEAVLPFATHKDPRVRAEAAQSLRRVRSPFDTMATNRAIDDALLQLALDPDYEVRLAALIGLPSDEAYRQAVYPLPMHSGWGRPEGSTVLRAVALASGVADGDVLAAALPDRDLAYGALQGMFGEPHLRPANAPYINPDDILRRIPSLDPAIAEAVVRWWLTDLPQVYAPTMLKAVENATDPSVKAALLRACEPFRDRVPDDVIAAALTQESSELRVAGMLLAGHTHIDTIHEATADKSDRVRMAAERTAARLGDEHALLTIVEHRTPAEAQAALRGWFESGHPAPESWTEMHPRLQYEVALHATPDRALELLRAEEHLVRVGATGALTRLDYDDPRRTEAFEAMRSSDDATVRWISLQDGDPPLTLGPTAKEQAQDIRSFGQVDPSRFIALAADSPSWLVQAEGRLLAERSEQPWPQAREIPALDVTLTAAQALNYATVITSAGTFTIAFDTDAAPLAAWHFAARARDGFYDDHPLWLDTDQTLQTGSQAGDWLGPDDRYLPAESARGPFARGDVLLPSTFNLLPTSDTRFEVVKAEWLATPEIYTHLGRVVEGMEVVDELTDADRIVAITIEEAP